MSAGIHTPGLGVEISLRIGQRVRHRDYKGQQVTGVVRGLQVDQEGALMADVALDAPIVIPADSHSRAIDIHRQYAPAHEFSPFDDRDELIKGLLALLQGWVDSFADCIEGGEADPLVSATRAAIAKESGASTDHDPPRGQPADGDLVIQATSQATWAREFVRDCRDDFSNRAEGC